MAIYFPNSGSFSLSGLTVEHFAFTPAASYTRARVFVGVKGIPENVTITFSNFKLSGPGITTTLNYTSTVTRDSFDNIPEGEEQFLDYYTARPNINLNTPISSWNSSTNLASFNINSNGILPGEAQIFYAVQYSNGSTFNTAFGNIDLAAFPTFGLPIGSIGLITSRFGTVGNYLRLRNQGQV
jgi:hypothetical protein